MSAVRHSVTGMTLDDPDTTDASLLLDGLADVLDLLPTHPGRSPAGSLAEERADVIRACRQLARQIHPATIQSFDDAKGYAGAEIRNAILRALFGTDGAMELLERN